MSQKTLYASFDNEKDTLRSLKILESLAICDPEKKTNSRYRTGQIALKELEQFENLSNHSNQEIADIAFSLIYIFSEEFPEEDSCNFIISNIDRATNLATQAGPNILSIDSLAKSIVNSIKICDLNLKKQASTKVIKYLDQDTTIDLASNVLDRISSLPNLQENMTDSFIQDPAKLAYFLEVDSIIGRVIYNPKRFHELVRTAESENNQHTLLESFIEYAAISKSIIAPDEVAAYILECLGFNSKFVQEAWENGFGGYSFSKETANSRNIGIISKLERTNPGSALQLYKEFGICNFGRYGADVLIDQYNQKNDQGLDYGVITMPYADHNSILSENYRLFIKKLYNFQKERGAGIRIYECQTNQEVLDALIDPKLDEQLDFAIIAGHGNGISIQQGRSESGSLLTKKSLGNLTYQTKLQLQSAFKPGAMVVLDSCHAAIEDGIAEDIAEIMNVPVSGAMEASKLISVEPLVTSSGGLKLAAIYLKNSRSRTILPR